MTTGVSIILPIVRPKKANRCKIAIRKNAGISRRRIEVVSEVDKDRIGAPKMVARLVERSRFPVVCFLGDDTIPQKGFLKAALLKMAEFPDGWGLVGLNDQHNGGGLATHWMADKRLLPLLGGEFFHTGYRHCFCDNELTMRCRQLGRYAWAEDAVIIHDHPVINGTLPDSDYQRVYRRDNYIYDEMLFYRRVQSKWGLLK